MEKLTEHQIELVIKECISTIKGDDYPSLDFSKKLVRDYGFESLDIIDFFFEIQRKTGILLDLSEIAIKLGAQEGRRFNDITLAEIKSIILEKMN